MNEHRRERKSALVTGLLCGAMVFSVFESEVGAETAPDGNDFLIIQDGLLQPVLNVSSLRDPYYTNENSEVLRFCVYVETDNDTDGDGMADLVKALVQVPRAAVEGQYKAGTIYDPTPYGAGTIQQDYPKTDEPFDYNVLHASHGLYRGPRSSPDADPDYLGSVQGLPG